MSPGFARWSMVLGLALLTVMARRLWLAGDGAARFGEATQQLLISYRPLYWMLAASVALYAVVLDIARLERGGPIAPLSVGGARCD